jgi:serine/threonine protein kinase
VSEQLKKPAPPVEADSERNPDLVVPDAGQSKITEDALEEVFNLISSAPANDLCGQIIGDHYEILSLLGTGGLGAVYKAQHKLLNKVMAIKFLLPGKLLDGKALMRFQREAQAAIGLTHPNIAGVQEFGIYNEMPYLVMEYVEGRSLSEIIQMEGALNPLRALSITKQALHALAYAQRKNIIHRDIKPANIIIYKSDDGEETVKLIDFGIAKIVEAEESVDLTKTGEIFGTPNYMSPEQCRGLPTSFKTDIYCLGCVAYEMLSGSPPFGGDTAIEVLMKHVNENPKLLKPPEDAIGFERVIDRALAKDPNNRYSSANEMLSELMLIESGRRPKKTFFIKAGTAKRGIMFSIFAILIGFVSCMLFLFFLSAPDTIQSVSKKISENPNVAENYFLRADLFAKQQNNEAAIADLTTAARLRPESPRIYGQRSYCETELGHYKEALDDAKKAIELAPDDYMGYVHKARAEVELGDLQQAIKDCDRSIELNPDNDANYQFPAYDVRAYARIQLGQFTDALLDANKAIALSPKPKTIGTDYASGLTSRSYVRRADANIGLGRFQDALNDADKALLYDPKSAMALDRKATALGSLQRFEEAMAAVDEAIAISPSEKYLNDHRDRILKWASAIHSGKQGKGAETENTSSSDQR